MQGQEKKVTQAALNAAVNARLAELGYTEQGTVAAAAATGTKPKKAPPKRERGGADVICYYDGIAGHVASKCETRQADRNRGVWRPTVNDPETTKAQWDNMSTEQRQKGQKQWGKAAPVANAQPPSQQRPPAQMPQNPSTSYASAARAQTLEDQFRDFIQQPRQYGYGPGN